MAEAELEKKVSDFTAAPARITAEIAFSGMPGEDVFEIMGDPDRITDWYLLAKDVHRHPPGPDGEERFDVEFIYFGKVYEEVLYWAPPDRYIYKAEGPDFPIKDYIAIIEVAMNGEDSGVMRWSMYFNDIEGVDQQKALPVMLPPITRESVERLAPMLGGEVVTFESNFEGIAA
jgi:hypothetical protein